MLGFIFTTIRGFVFFVIFASVGTQQGEWVPIDKLPNRPTTRDFRVPKSFRSEDFPVANDYIDVYKVKNVHERLQTWKLYNLCRLILAADADTYKASGETFEIDPFGPLFKLLVLNVPDIDLMAEQRAEVYFLRFAAIAIEKRFGKHLEKLTALRKTPLWHQIWMDHQNWRGISFGKVIFRNFTIGKISYVFDVVNLDSKPHAVFFTLEFDTTNHKPSKMFDFEVYENAESGTGEVFTGTLATGLNSKVIRAHHREHFVLPTNQFMPRGVPCRISMQPGLTRIWSTTFVIGK